MTDFYDAIPNDWIGPGETTAVEVEGIPVAIANVEGEFYAFGNFCPHQATPLGGQALQRKCVIVCPEHHSMRRSAGSSSSKPFGSGSWKMWM